MINNIIYEKKINTYKNSNSLNKNYKINKYLNKLNIHGGTESKSIDMKSFANATLLGSGSFGTVKLLEIDNKSSKSSIAKE